MTLPDHLKKVHGSSFEDVVEVIQKEGLEYRVRREPAMGTGQLRYFRDSTIEVYSEGSTKLYCALPYSSYMTNGVNFFSVRAEYEIQEGFDWSEFDKAMYFSQGLLLERVRVEKVSSRWNRLSRDGGSESSSEDF